MVKPTGSPDAPVFVCGEAPGREEIAQGIPFVGQSGKMLWAELSKEGVSRADCFVTNANMRNALTTGPALALEAPRLEAELAASKARVVFCVGAVAFKAVTGGLRLPDGKVNTNLTDLRGYVLLPGDFAPVMRRTQVQVGVYKTRKAGKYEKGDPKFAMKRMPFPRVLPPTVEAIIATTHPSAIMKTEFETLPSLTADAGRVGRWLKGDVQMHPREELSYFPYPVPLRGGSVAIDIETAGMDTDAIARVGASDGETTWSAVWDANARAAVAALVTDRSRLIVYHNAAFDEPRLELAGVPRRTARLWDTMYAAQLLNPSLPKGLGRTCTLLLDLRPWKHMSETNPALYNALDAYVTAHLQRAQEEVLM